MFVLKNLVGEFLTPLVALIYRNVAKSYNLMIGFTKNNYFGSLQDAISNLQNNLYTLLAIFMLFRITISLLTYLIEPDKMGDSKVGMGKLPMRIAISITLVLTLNSFIFPLLRKVEQALLAPDSIINNIFSSNIEIDKNIDLSKEIDTNLLVNDASAASCDLKDNYMKGCTLSDAELKSRIISQIKEHLRNIDAVTNNYNLNECNSSGTNFPCVEFRKTDTIKDTEVCSGCVSSVSVIMIEPDAKVLTYGKNSIYAQKVMMSDTFYLMSFSSTASYPTYFHQECYDGICSSSSDNKVHPNDARFVVTISRNIKDEAQSERICYYNYYGDVTKENNGVVETKAQNTNYAVAIKFSNKSFDDPQIFGLVGNKENEYWSLSNYTNGSKFSIESYEKNGGVSNIDIQNDAKKTLNETGNCPESITNMDCIVNEMTNVYTCKLTSKSKVTNSQKQSSNGLYNGSTTMNETMQKATGDANANNEDSSYFEYTSGLEGTAGLSFATTVLKSFTDPSDVIAPEFLTDSRSTSTVSASVGDDKVRMDVIMLVLVGIAAIVMLWAICIEVVVRYLKLALLEVISPIAVMSYMDPNDKIFSSWVKQYMGAYFNLFIQLLVINAAIFFISVIDVTAGGISTILVYAGIFIFIKTMPGMISKLFGLENAGSFKDSLGMVKKGLLGAAGIGMAGAAIAGNTARNMVQAGMGGLGTGGVLAAGGRALLSAPGALVKGLSSGVNGKVTDAAKSAWATGTTRGNLYRQGIGTGTQLGASFFGGTFGYSRQVDESLDSIKSEQEVLEKMVSYKDAIQNIAKDNTSFGKDVLNKKDANGNPIFGDTTQKKAAITYANAQYDAHNETSKYQAWKSAHSSFGWDEETSKTNYIQEQMNGLGIFSDAEIRQAKYEKGKAAQISEQVSYASNSLKNTIVGVTDKPELSGGITSVDDVFTLEGYATSKRSENNIKIDAMTTNDPRYRASKASADAMKK